MLKRDIGFGEGALYRPSTNEVFFSDQPKNMIYRWTEKDGFSVFMRPAGYTGAKGEMDKAIDFGPNAIALDKNENLVFCQQGHRRIARIDEKRFEVEVLSDSYDGKKLNNTNDLCVLKDGSIFFTDPGFWHKRRAPEANELDFSGIYKITPDGKTVVLGAATEQYRHYLEFMNEVYESGAFSKNVYTEDGTASRALTSENHVAISPFASYLTPANFESGEMELTILEPLTSQYWDTKHWKPRSSANWSGTVVSSSCKDIETMVRWLDSQYATQDNPLTEDGNIWGLSFWLGEYGKDFTLDKEAKEYKILDHEGYESGSTWLSSNSFGYTLGLDDFLYVEKSNTGLEIKGRGTIDNLMPYAERPFDMNSIALEPEERDDYTDRWTDIDNYIKESTAKFITGELDIASGWDKYLADLDNMGLPEVLEIYQTAYDRQSA